MVNNINAQEWLESQEKYNNKQKRAEIKKLNIDEKGLKGHLDLSDFINLEKFRLSYTGITKLDLTRNTKLTELDCSGNQLEELKINLNVPLTRLNCSGNKLTSLNLSNDLVNIDCSENQLKSLDTSHCLDLEHLYCFDNQLTSLILPTSYEKLKTLDLMNNSFKDHSLSFLSNFDNLQVLRIANNRFFGPLSPLKNMRRLKILDISDTDISDNEGGLETLPSSLDELFCSSRKRTESKCKILEKQLALWQNNRNLNREKEVLEDEFNSLRSLLKKIDVIEKDVEKLLNNLSVQVEEDKDLLPKLLNIQEEIISIDEEELDKQWQKNKKIIEKVEGTDSNEAKKSLQESEKWFNSQKQRKTELEELLRQTKEKLANFGIDSGEIEKLVKKWTEKKILKEQLKEKCNKELRSKNLAVINYNFVPSSISPSDNNDSTAIPVESPDQELLTSQRIEELNKLKLEKRNWQLGVAALTITSIISIGANIIVPLVKK